MDKQKTITIKINGKDRSYKQGEAKHDENKKEKGTDKLKVTAWNETAATQESTEDQFDWVLPDPIVDEGNKGKKTSKSGNSKAFRLPSINKSTNKNKSSKSSGMFPRIFLNVSLAIVVGLGFGLIILNTVTSKSEEGGRPTTTNPATETPSNSNDHTGTQSVELPVLSTFVVQGGVFTTKESAQTAIQSLEAKGIPAQEVTSNGSFAILLGTAGTLEEVKKIAADFKNKGAEVFPKPYDVPAASIAGVTKEESIVLTAAPELFQLLSAGNTSDGDAVNNVKAQLTELDKIDDSKISNKQVAAVKQHLETGANAFLGKQSSELQAETLAFLAAWQSLGK